MLNLKVFDDESFVSSQGAIFSECEHKYEVSPLLQSGELVLWAVVAISLIHLIMIIKIAP